MAGAARPTRREILERAARVGLVVAAAPLSGLAGCADGSTTARTASESAEATPVPSAASPPPTASAAATAALSPSPDPGPVTVAITGDVMLGRSVSSTIVATHDRYPFNDTADDLRAYDLTVGNLECVVSLRGQPVPGKTYHFRADPVSYQRLNAAGFDIVSLANNHCGDFGAGAFSDMLAALPDHGIAPVGAGVDLTSAHLPVIRTVRSTAIGFLAYCEIAPTSFAATRSSPGHAWLDVALMRSDITAVRPHVDQLIVFLHWGTEYATAQTAHQRDVARAAVVAGADVVVGAHPHVVQPAETHAGRPIVYSLGNFVFDEMNEDVVRRGNVLVLTLQGSRLLDWKLRPSFITGNLGAPRWL